MKQAGVLPHMVMLFGQMNEPPSSRFHIGHAALTMAEYFRDDEHRDVLLLMDNIFRFIQTGMEVSGLMGQMPSRPGYQPTLGTELSPLEERIANTESGAITSIQAVYVPADDFTDPAAVHTFSHLSASIVLSRKRASEGLFPAIDPLQSSSKMATPGIVDERHYRLAQQIRRTLAQYAELKDIIAMLGLEQLSQEDRKVVARARRLSDPLGRPIDGSTKVATSCRLPIERLAAAIIDGAADHRDGSPKHRGLYPYEFDLHHRWRDCSTSRIPSRRSHRWLGKFRLTVNHIRRSAVTPDFACFITGHNPDRITNQSVSDYCRWIQNGVSRLSASNGPRRIHRKSSAPARRRCEC